MVHQRSGDEVGHCFKWSPNSQIYSEIKLFGTGRGWNFAIENLANMIVMGLILMIGRLVISFVIGLPQIFTSIPFFVSVITGDFFSDPEAFFRGLGATVVLQLLYLPIFLVLEFLY